MSYPWWRLKVTFASNTDWCPDPSQEGESVEFTATGVSPTDAMIDLVKELYFEQDWPVPGEANRYLNREILSVRYLHGDTYGIDPVSDVILEVEAAAAKEKALGQ